MNTQETTPESMEERFELLKNYSTGDVEYHCQDCEQEVLLFIKSEITRAIQEDRARLREVVAGMKGKDSDEPSGCNCGEDTNGLLNAMLTEVLIILK